LKTSELLFRLIRNNFLTPYRIYNAVKAVISWKLKLNNPIGLPPVVMIEPTNYCNLHCPLCLTGINKLNRKQGFMSYENYLHILDDLSSTTMILSLYFSGEPFMNKEIIPMIHEAKNRNIFVRISTNGHFLNSETSLLLLQSGLDHLIIGIDGATSETYESMRCGGDYLRVIEGIKCIVETKKRLNIKSPHISLQFIVTSYNEHEIDSIKKLFKDLGADSLRIKPAYLYNDSFILNRTKYVSNINKRQDVLFDCWRIWLSSTILWDGNVVPCCYDEQGKILLGNLLNKKFVDIWKGNTFSNFRKMVKLNRKEIPLCNLCNSDLFDNVSAVMSKND